MLSNKKFDDISLNLMEDSNLFGTGGTNCDDKRIIGLNDELWNWTKDQLQIYKDTSYNLVTAIVAPDRETFYVDAQGYNYARYVAIA